MLNRSSWALAWGVRCLLMPSLARTCRETGQKNQKARAAHPTRTNQLRSAPDVPWCSHSHQRWQVCLTKMHEMQLYHRCCFLKNHNYVSVVFLWRISGRDEIRSYLWSRLWPDAGCVLFHSSYTVGTTAPEVSWHGCFGCTHPLCKKLATALWLPTSS